MTISKKMERVVSAVEQKLIDEGLIIEGGFAGLMLMIYPNGEPSPEQRSEMRKAFFAGAYHLHTTMMWAMDPGEEPTQSDMRKMALMHEELMRFEKQIRAEAAEKKQTRGNA